MDSSLPLLLEYYIFSIDCDFFCYFSLNFCFFIDKVKTLYNLYTILNRIIIRNFLGDVNHGARKSGIRFYLYGSQFWKMLCD